MMKELGIEVWGVIIVWRRKSMVKKLIRRI